VLDVQPKLASRVRLPQAGDTNKNDPNDALSVAVAALRSRACRQVTADDYSAVLKVWSKRHRDLSRTRNQAACRLHAVLCDLVPGGHSKEISAAQAARLLEQAAPSGAVARARAAFVGEFLADLRRLDTQLRGTRKKLAAAVKASGTTLTQVFGVGHRHSDGRAYYEKKLAEGKTHKEALRSLKRRISDAIFARLQADARQAAGASVMSPGGQPGNDSASSAAGSHPAHRLFGQATPGPDTTIRPGTTAGIPSGPRSSRPESRGRAGHSSIAATLQPAKRQVQVERPERSEDERPGGAARRRPHSAARKAPVGTTSRKNPTPT